MDASKAFKNVKLEQVIIGCKNRPEQFITGNITKFNNNLFLGEKILPFTDIIPANLTKEEIHIGEIIVQNSVSFGEYFKLIRGIVPIVSLRETGEVKIYQGKYIQGYYFFEPDKGISKEEARKYEKFMLPKLMFQQIVSHMMLPSPHVRLIGAVDLDGNRLSIDTVSNIFIKRKIFNMEDIISLTFTLAVLNSRVMSWFADRFVYAKAIRTMHFDNYQLGKLRFPTNIVESEVQKVVKLVNLMLSHDLSDKDFSTKAAEIERMINNRVAKFFGLNDEGIALIDNAFGGEYLCNMGLLGRQKSK